MVRITTLTGKNVNLDLLSLVRRTSRRELGAKGVTFANAERRPSPLGMGVGKTEGIPGLQAVILPAKTDSMGEFCNLAQDGSSSPINADQMI